MYEGARVAARSWVSIESSPVFHDETVLVTAEIQLWLFGKVSEGSIWTRRFQTKQDMLEGARVNLS